MRFALSIAAAALCALPRCAEPQTLPFAPLDSVSSSAVYPTAIAITEARPSAGMPSKLPNRWLAIAAWPGYGALAGDRSPVAQAQRVAFAVERAGFFLDSATTGIGLTAHKDFAERDPVNTLFGNRNVAGVLGSMAAWEIGYSYASVKIPRLLRNTRLRGAARSSALIFDSLLAGQRIRVSACNRRLTREERISPAESCQQ